MFVLKKIIAQFFFPVPLCLEILVIGLFLLLFTRKQRIGKFIVTIGGNIICNPELHGYSKHAFKIIRAAISATRHNCNI